MKYEINLSETENKALSYVALNQKDWIENAVHERCRAASEEIIRIATDWYLDNGIQVPSTRDAIINDAFERGIIKSAAQRQNSNSSSDL